MPSGGRRYGAGRPKGAKTKKTQAVAMKAAAEGITPLEYMLETLRSAESTDEEKRWAAEKSAPYVHPRLSAAHVTGDVEHESFDIRLIPVQPVTYEELERAEKLTDEERNGFFEPLPQLVTGYKKGD